MFFTNPFYESEVIQKMKKTVRTLSIIAAFALMATIIPLLRGGGLTAYASGSFDV